MAVCFRASGVPAAVDFIYHFHNLRLVSENMRSLELSNGRKAWTLSTISKMLSLRRTFQEGTHPCRNDAAYCPCYRTRAAVCLGRFQKVLAKQPLPAGVEPPKVRLRCSIPTGRKMDMSGPAKKLSLPGIRVVDGMECRRRHHHQCLCRKHARPPKVCERLRCSMPIRRMVCGLDCRSVVRVAVSKQT